MAHAQGPRSLVTEAKTASTFAERDLIFALLLVVGLQMLCVQLFSTLGALRWAWIAQVAIWLALAVWKIRYLLRRPALCDQVFEGWRAPWPWVVAGLLLAQITLYPPTMHDSLSYRLPRMLLALQEGSLGGAHASDGRVHTMPWGWESLALPFASLNLLNWSKWIGLECWALTYHILFRWARLGGAPAASARWLALAFATSPFFLIQASSTANDLLAGCLLLMGASLMLDFRARPTAGAVLGSLLALVMAANVKPQFLVLGLPWLLWWTCAPGRVWSRVRLSVLCGLAPLFVMVSPLPILTINLMETGSLAGLGPERVMREQPPLWQMVIAGSLQFGLPQLQLPVFPWAEPFNQVLQGLPGMATLAEGIPKFQPGWALVQTIDNANLGLFHLCLLASGLVCAVRKQRTIALPWCAGVLLAFWIACSQVVVITMARSFCPFLMVLCPLAIMALAPRMQAARVRWMVIAIIPIGLLSAVLNPSAPLWPARSLQTLLQERGHPGAAQQISTYLRYQQRAEVGAGMLDAVPAGEAVGVLIRPGTPTSRLGQPRWQDHRIVHLHQTPSAAFQQSDIPWLLIAEKYREWNAGQLSRYQALEGWSRVHRQRYLPNLLQGEEQWELYMRKNE